MPDDAAFSALAGHPLLQVVVAALASLMAGVWMIVRAERDKRNGPAAAELKPSAENLFSTFQMFAHHVGAVVNSLGEMVQILKRIEDALRPIACEQQRQSRLIEEQTATHQRLMRDLQGEVEDSERRRRSD